MEWFFATTEGFLPDTSIMVGRTTCPCGADFEEFLPIPGKLANRASGLYDGADWKKWARSTM
jgi:hypothetical protein